MFAWTLLAGLDRDAIDLCNAITLPCFPRKCLAGPTTTIYFDAFLPKGPIERLSWRREDSGEIYAEARHEAVELGIWPFGAVATLGCTAEPDAYGSRGNQQLCRTFPALLQVPTRT